MNDYPQGSLGGANPFLPNVAGGRALATPAIYVEKDQAGPVPEINFSEIIRILLAWRWLILGFLAVCVAGAVIITLLTTPLYKATSRLEVNAPEAELIQGAQVGVAQQDFSFLPTQYGLLQSRSLAERVAQDLNLAGNELFASQNGSRAARQRSATSKLVSNFEVAPVRDSRLIDISYSSQSPEMAMRVTNSFADNFINANLERRYEASSYARNFLEHRIAAVKNELEQSERNLVAYAQREGIISTADKDGNGQPLDAASLGLLNNALAQAQAQRIMAEQRYRQAGQATDTSDVINNPTVQALRGQRAALLTDYQQKLGLYKPDFPDMVQMRAKIDALTQQIGVEAGATAGGRSNSLREEYLAAVADERSLQDKVNQMKGQVLDLRGRSIQYNILQRELDTNRTLYDALLQRYKEIGVAGGVGTNLVSIVDAARTPTSPYKPNLIFNLLIGIVVGLAGGIALAFGLEFINDTIKNPDDVRNKLRLTALGAIPVKPRGVSMADQLEDPASPISEAYYSLRTSLQFATPEGAPRLLLVTSTRAAEGKSSTTMALAQNFARLGNSTLVIDADMRKPAFVTGTPTNDGLSKLLTGNGVLREQVLQTKVENLWLLPCGPLPPNPAELLASSQLKRILVEAKQHFDMVIVDGPPVLGLADAPLLGAVSDGVLLVIESGTTRRGAVLDAIIRLRDSGSQILGAVLSKYKPQSSGYGYGYGYAYQPYQYGGVTDRDRQIRLIASAEQQDDG